MSPEIALRRIRAEEWEAYRGVRLEALRTDPLAFGSTLEREAALPPETWQERVRNGALADRRATFVAEDGSGRFVGIATVIDRADRFEVVGMWVHPNARGQGLGGRLLDATLAWVESSFPSAQVVLGVNPAQEAVVRLYRSRGFSFTGVDDPSVYHPGTVVRQMVRGTSGEPPDASRRA